MSLAVQTSDDICSSINALADQDHKAPESFDPVSPQPQPVILTDAVQSSTKSQHTDGTSYQRQYILWYRPSGQWRVAGVSEAITWLSRRFALYWGKRALQPLPAIILIIGAFCIALGFGAAVRSRTTDIPLEYSFDSDMLFY